MTKLYKKHELLLKDTVNRIGLRQLERLYGLEVKVYRSEKNVFSTVYGVEAGDESEVTNSLTVLITGTTFSPISMSNVGTLQEGFLYTSQPEKIFAGDTIEIQREDGAAFKFKVISPEGLGTTETVIKQFRIAALGEDNLR
jgi:hypothetical protein